MATIIRTSIALTNPWYISKHRYLELKHFCFQYPEWRKERLEIESRIVGGFSGERIVGGDRSSLVERQQEQANQYEIKMSLVEKAAVEAGDDLWPWLLKGVTKECGYEYLHMTEGIPCCKDVYYRMYRKFFWVLSREKNKLLYEDQNIT